MKRYRTDHLLFSLFWPLALQSLAYSVLGMIDRIMVGQLNDKAISAVGIGGQCLFFTVALAGAIASACSILAAQYYGAGDKKGMNSLIATSLHLTLAVGIGFSVLIHVFSRSGALWLANGDRQIADLTGEYLLSINLSLPFMLLTFVLTGVMRAFGDTSCQLKVSLLTILLNSGLNVLLITGKFGFPRWEVAGAGFATAVAQVAGFTLAVRFFLGKTIPHLTFAWADLGSFSGTMARQILGQAVPIGFDALFWQAASLAYTRVVGISGADALPAYFVFLGVRSFGYIPLGALASAASVMVGQHLGAGHPWRARSVVQRTLFLSLFSSLIMGCGYLALASPYVAFFSVSPQIAGLSAWLIRAFCLVIPFESVVVLLAFILRSGGDAMRVSLMTLLTFWLVGIPGAWLFGVKFGWGLKGCFLGMALESSAKAFLFAQRERQKAWARCLVPPNQNPPGVTNSPQPVSPSSEGDIAFPPLKP
jgi:putative MATE family efflux protein